MQDEPILGGVHTLTFVDCGEITDAGLAHLSRVHTLTISGMNSELTDAGISHLGGVRNLTLSSITDASLAFLSGPFLVFVKL
jgi:hypothetical protein